MPIHCVWQFDNKRRRDSANNRGRATFYRSPKSLAESRHRPGDHHHKKWRFVCRSQGIISDFRILSIEGNKFGIIAAYLIRCLEGSARILTYRGRTRTCSATDILPDVLPAVVLKVVRGQNSRMVRWVFHLIPHYSRRTGSRFVNIVSYLSQRFSFFLMRRFSDTVIVDNSQVKNDLISLGFRSTDIIVVPLGVDKVLIEAAKPSPKCFVTTRAFGSTA